MHLAPVTRPTRAEPNSHAAAGRGTAVTLTLSNYVNYGVTFTMVAPSHVKGNDANPVFRELASQTGAPSWNFNKYLVDSSGKVVEQFGSNVSPDSKVLEAAIESVL